MPVSSGSRSRVRFVLFESGQGRKGGMLCFLPLLCLLESRQAVVGIGTKTKMNSKLPRGRSGYHIPRGIWRHLGVVHDAIEEDR